MKFFEHKTLGSLSDIDTHKLIDSIDTGKKNFNTQKLVALLELLKKDMLVSYHPSLEVGVSLESRKNTDNMYLTLFCKKPIMPTLLRDLKKLSIDINFKTFDKTNINDFLQTAITRAYGFDKDKNQCNPHCIDMIRFAKRIDNFLECNGTLYNKIIKNALYIENSKDSYDIFSISQHLEMIEISVNHKANSSKSIITPFAIKIRGSYNLMKIELCIYNMEIELSKKEYDTTSDTVILDIIRNLCAVKKIEVYSMSDLKSQLALLQMIHD